MTWSSASFLLLALALLGGFAAYERTRPPAKVLALVAALAALAALGRVAFAPLPNVKPTTDIVLVAGAALGPAAGWAVGAVAALASNLVFGQGPWTPWQMAGWGVCGLMGAGLAWAYRRRGRERLPGRLALALTGFLAALVFGAFVDFGTAATAGSQDLWPRFAAMYLGTSLAWNLAHAAANVAFAFIFGPALLRAVSRFRDRFTVTWRAVPAAAAVPLALLLAGTLLLARPPAEARAASPSGYLTSAQNTDGGWGARAGARSSSLYTAWAALGLAAAGVNPLDQRRGGDTPIDLLRGSVARLEDTGEIERTMLVLGAAGLSPRSFGGRDLKAILLRRQRRDGSFAGQIPFTAFGVLALRATGSPRSAGPIRRAIAFLARHQERGGGWSFYRRGSGADIDDTGAVLEALGSVGRGRGPAARKGAAWLVRRQGKSGGFPAQPGGFANAQSTAFAVQGLIAAGRNPERVRRRGGRSAMTYLRARVRADGSVAYSATGRQTPVWVTGQALLALRKKPLPLRPVPRSATVSRRAATGDGGGGTGAAGTGGDSGATAAGPSGASGADGGGSAPGAAATDTASKDRGSPTSLFLAESAGALSAVALLPFAMAGR